MSKQGGLGLLAVIVFLVLAFQNFSGSEREAADANHRIVTPMSLEPRPQNFAVQSASSSQPACAEEDKNVVYLKLPKHFDRQRITGHFRDSVKGTRIDVDFVVGRDHALGDCEDRTSVGEDRIKICFSGPVGPYFSASLVGDDFRMEHDFVASAYCEGTRWLSVDLIVEK